VKRSFLKGEDGIDDEQVQFYFLYFKPEKKIALMLPEIVKKWNLY